MKYWYNLNNWYRELNQGWLKNVICSIRRMSQMIQDHLRKNGIRSNCKYLLSMNRFQEAWLKICVKKGHMMNKLFFGYRFDWANQQIIYSVADERHVRLAVQSNRIQNLKGTGPGARQDSHRGFGRNRWRDQWTDGRTDLHNKPKNN